MKSAGFATTQGKSHLTLNKLSSSYSSPGWLPFGPGMDNSEPGRYIHVVMSNTHRPVTPRHRPVAPRCSWTGLLVVAVLACSCRHATDGESETPASRDPGHPAADGGEVVVEATVESNDRIAITLVNGTAGQVEVRRALRVEQDRGEGGQEGWSALVAVGPLWIRESCAAMDGVLYPDGLADDCLTLERGRVVRAQPWLGTVGDAQCACEECAQVPAGRYRIVMVGCEGERYESQPFELGPSEEDE